MKTWPSRRVQIAVILILLLGAAVQIFILPISKEGRAEQLYQDSWLSDNDLLPFWESERDAVRELNRALRLSPGNSLYEQALVYKCPEDRLSQLLKTHKLGQQARALAEARIYAGMQKGCPGELPHNAAQKENDARLLSQIETLCKVDPQNSLPHYLKALFYVDHRKTKEALIEVEAGNRIGCMRYYLPELSTPVRDTAASPSFWLSLFNGNTTLRNLVRKLSFAGQKELQHGNVSGACRILEAGCQMGICTAKAHPQSVINFLVGDALFVTCGHPLIPVYKDFGMQERRRELNRATEQLDRRLNAIRLHIADSDAVEEAFRTARRLSAVQTSLLATSFVSMAFLLLATLLWGLLAFTRRIRKGVVFTANAWGEGWLARLFLGIVLPLPVIVAAVAIFLPDVLGIPMVEKVLNLSRVVDFPAKEGWLFASIIPVFLQAIVSGFVLRKLHRAYDEAEGHSTSFIRFLFRSPLQVKVWVGRQISAAFAGEALFIICIAMLVVTVYKPLVGCQPWQLNRLPSKYIAQDMKFAEKLTSGLKLNLGFGPEGKPSHSDKEKQ